MEKKINKSAERAKEAEKLSNVITNKMTLVFCVLVAAVVFLVRLSQNSAFELSFIGLPLLITRIVSGVCLAAALVYRFLSAKKGMDEKRRVFSAPLLLGMAAAFCAASLLYLVLGPFRTIVGLLAAALLFFVFEIYPLDFFLFSITAVIGAAAVSLLNSAAFNGHIALVNGILIALCVLAALLCGFAAFALSKHGMLKIGGRKILAPVGMRALVVYGGGLLSVLAVLGTFLLGFPLYFIAAVCVIYLVVAIFYTVKLM